MSHKNKKILIIGSSGLVGGNLLAFSSRYPLLTIPTFHLSIPDTFQKTGLHLDITNPNALREILGTVQPDCVVNLSCMEVVRCENEPDRAHQLQVTGVKDLAVVCKEYNIRLIHLSSDMVYSGEKGSPYTLKDEPDPVSVYGRTKLAGERALQEVLDNFVIVRSALVLGKGRFRIGGFLDWMIKRIARQEKLPLFSDQLRTPIIVDDLIALIFALAESSFTGTLLAGGAEGLSRVEMGEKLFTAMGSSKKLINPISMDSIISSVPLQRDLRLDNSKIKEVVGREGFTDIDDYFLRGVKSVFDGFPRQI